MPLSPDTQETPLAWNHALVDSAKNTGIALAGVGVAFLWNRAGLARIEPTNVGILIMTIETLNDLRKAKDLSDGQQARGT